MCKHKSGGMSKTSGDSSQGTHPERPAPHSSHPFLQGSAALSTQAVNDHSATTHASNRSSSCDTYSFHPNTLEQNFTSMPSKVEETQKIYQDACHLVPSIPRSQSSYQDKNTYHSDVQQNQSDFQDSYPLMPNDRQPHYQNPATYPFTSNVQDIQADYQDQACYHFIPNVQEAPPGYDQQAGFDFFEKSQQQSYLDSDEDTEQSPMLAQQHYTQPWNPNIVHEEAFNILPPSPFATPYPCPSSEEATNCDNLSTYHHFKIQNTFQKPVSYTPSPQYTAHPGYINDFEGSPIADLRRPNNAIKKKWLLNQKCKSADSEPDSFNGYSTSCGRGLSLIGYNYIQGTDALGTGSYSKPMYSHNGDPLAGPSGLQRPCSINWETGGATEDNEFRSRSYSLTPTVNFAVFESESSSDTEDIPEVKLPPEDIKVPSVNELHVKTIEDSFELPTMSMGKVLPVSPSAAQLSIASSYGDNGSPICKICHTTAKENDPLISPCRCSGTMQYIHCGCLMRWLEVCHKRGRRPASCELCQYQYHWHKKFKVRHWQFPHCTRKDKILHLLFIFSVLLMVSCASLTVMFFKQDKGTRVDLDRTELTHAEIGNLVCGVLFFVAFFVSIYVEAKSHDTLYQLLVKFIHINQQWYIDEYEKKETPPVAV